MSSHIRSHHAKRRLDALIRCTAKSLDLHRECYWRLIYVVRASSRLLVPAHCQGPARSRDGERIVSACAQLARFRSRWVREPEGWLAPEGSLHVQFRSLVNHLFARYSVPHFMARVWFAIRTKEWERQLYLHLARGLSVRNFTMPFPWQMGKLAARHFMQAPDDLTPALALRWARVRSLGGDTRLARTLLTTALMAPQEDEDFWDTIIRFLIANDPLSKAEIQEIVAFIHRQKFRTAAAVWGLGGGQQLMQPDFSLEQCSLSKLRRRMVDWRSQRTPSLPLAASSPVEIAWNPISISPFRYETESEIWTIDEILTGRELRIEGANMQHCVASYTQACVRRKTSIWSMKVQTGESLRRVLTIEICPDDRSIRQAKGKKNLPPGEAAKTMLARWAAQEGLKFRQ